MTSAKLVIFPETNHQFFLEGGPFQIALAHNGPIAVPGITDTLVWMPQNLGIFGYAVFSGLQQLVVITGLPHIFGAIKAQLLADTVAFCDSMNDYDMMKAAGFSVAMGNACEELKRMADVICESVW